MNLARPPIVAHPSHGPRCKVPARLATCARRCLNCGRFTFLSPVRFPELSPHVLALCGLCQESARHQVALHRIASDLEVRMLATMPDNVRQMLGLRKPTVH